MLEQKLKAIVRTADPAQQENPREAFGALEPEKIETFQRTENKSNSAVTK